MNDFGARVEALRLAASFGGTPQTILERANTYLQFLTGQSDLTSTDRLEIEKIRRANDEEIRKIKFGE